MTIDKLDKRLLAWRRSRGVSQRQAAGALGVPLNTWRNWERGRRGRRLAPATVERIEGLLRSGSVGAAQGV